MPVWESRVGNHGSLVGVKEFMGFMWLEVPLHCSSTGTGMQARGLYCSNDHRIAAWPGYSSIWCLLAAFWQRRPVARGAF
jgi:hypothetical protein